MMLFFSRFVFLLFQRLKILKESILKEIDYIFNFSKKKGEKQNIANIYKSRKNFFHLFAFFKSAEITRGKKNNKKFFFALIFHTFPGDFIFHKFMA